MIPWIGYVYTLLLCTWNLWTAETIQFRRCLCQQNCLRPPHLLFRCFRGWCGGAFIGCIFTKMQGHWARWQNGTKKWIHTSDRLAAEPSNFHALKYMGAPSDSVIRFSCDLLPGDRAASIHVIRRLSCKMPKNVLFEFFCYVEHCICLWDLWYWWSNFYFGRIGILNYLRRWTSFWISSEN